MPVPRNFRVSLAPPNSLWRAVGHGLAAEAIGAPEGSRVAQHSRLGVAQRLYDDRCGDRKLAA